MVKVENEITVIITENIKVEDNKIPTKNEIKNNVSKTLKQIGASNVKVINVKQNIENEKENKIIKGWFANRWLNPK